MKPQLFDDHPVPYDVAMEQGRFRGSVWVRDEGWQNLASILRSEGFSE